MNLKKISFVLMALVIPLFLLGQKGTATQKNDVLRAGISKIDITPDNSVNLYGYSARKSPSDGVHDPLSARAVVLENNGKKVVLISSDLGSYDNEVFSVFRESILKEFKLNESELFLSAIHSHSSPVLTLNKEGDNLNNALYTELLNKKLLTVIGQAFMNLKPVRTGVDSGSSPVGSNRRATKPDGSVTLGRNPYGPTDKEVLVMKLELTDGTPIGAIFDYATHATSLGSRNLKISGDILGLSAQFVEKILGKNLISPVFAGASANIDPWYRVLPEFNNETGWIPEPVLLGTLLGEEVVHVFRAIKEVKPGGDIITSYETIECPRKKNSNSTDEVPEQNKNATVPVNIIAARVGEDVAFVGFNVEMLTEIGLSIKAGSPFKYTFIITHCNGSSGYLPPAELYKEGGYEIASTNFEIGSAEMVVKKTLKMLYDMK